ncbi:MAG: hypothetical protein E7376_03790 [Clostridiales bacterium]|nr:hypothetical protein [Clostridiales bacterium]
MKINKNLGIILHILNILKAETDQEHLIPQKEIVKRLRALGINCRLYTVEKYLNCLRDFGYDIQTVKGTGTYLKKDSLNINDAYVLLESLNRANFALEKEYVLSIQNKLKKELNKYEIEELKNKNMLL